MNSVRAYYYLAKPGIVYGNLIAAIAGYLFAAPYGITAISFISMIVGIVGVMASACVFNNMIDRDIDQFMKRTKNRALVQGNIPLLNAAIYGFTLSLIGFTTLLLGTNILTMFVAVFGFVSYVFIYTYSKRYTVHSTLLGTLSGATPPVIGYTAITGTLDAVAVLLFLLLVAWQMPHFYAIAIFRRDEYAAASIPVLSVVRGNEAVREQIVAYAGLFILTCVLLGVYSPLSWPATAALVFIGTCWLATCLQPADDIVAWARHLFHFSLIVLLASCIVIALDGLVRLI